MDMQNTAEIVSWFNVAPRDVKIEIFARLPVEFVYRYRLVCKQWNDLLSSNDFLSKWAEVSLTRKQPRLVLWGYGPEMPWMTFCFYTRTWINSCFTLSFMEDWRGKPCSFYCNQSVPGLILVIEKISINGRVCNPYTKAFVDIPASNEMHCLDHYVLDQMKKSDASYRVVAVANMLTTYGNVQIGQMVKIYEPSQKRWNIAGYIPEDLIVQNELLSYHGSFYTHCFRRADNTDGIGFFTIPYEGEGSSIPPNANPNPNPIPILFAPFPEILRNWMQRQKHTLCWSHIITCGSRVLLVAKRWTSAEFVQAGGEEEGTTREIIIWQFITEVQGHPSNLPPWKWLEIARMPSSMWEKRINGSPMEDYFMSFIGVGDYVCFVPSIPLFQSEEIVAVATYNLIRNRWDWLPSLSTSPLECGSEHFPRAQEFIPNPRANVE